MSIRFDLTDLRLFLYVAEAASITHGATRANMAPASASERIRAMEDALGAPLLERTRRGVRLTPVGSALVHHARIVTQQLEKMRGELGDYAKGLRGHVRLLSNTVAIAELLPATLASFLSAHPNIDVELEDRPSREIVRMIAEGHADIGIVTDAVDLAEELETGQPLNQPLNSKRLELSDCRGSWTRLRLRTVTSGNGTEPDQSGEPSDVR